MVSAKFLHAIIKQGPSFIIAWLFIWHAIISGVYDIFYFNGMWYIEMQRIEGDYRGNPQSQTIVWTASASLWHGCPRSKKD